MLKALERFPEHPQLLADAARAEFHVNRIDEAEEHLATLLRLQPFHAGALHLRSTLRTQTPERNHVADLEARLQREPNRRNVVVAANFALAKEYEDLRQYDRSFAALSRGARTYRSTLRYDSATELAAHAAIRDDIQRANTRLARHRLRRRRPDLHRRNASNRHHAGRAHSDEPQRRFRGG